MSEQEWTVNRSTSYKVDADALRAEFRDELRDDGVDLRDDFEVVAACWENGVRDPHFIPTVFDDCDYELRGQLPDRTTSKAAK